LAGTKYSGPNVLRPRSYGKHPIASDGTGRGQGRVETPPAARFVEDGVADEDPINTRVEWLRARSRLPTDHADSAGLGDLLGDRLDPARPPAPARCRAWQYVSVSQTRA